MKPGLIIKREAWCLTGRGRLLGIMLTLTLFVFAIRFCGCFLALNQPAEAQVLIVEGWMPDYALKDAAREFYRGQYKFVIVAGSPLRAGYYLSRLKTSAELAAASLVALGLASNLVVAVPGPDVPRDRSLADARAVRRWIKENAPDLRSVNVCTLGVHARRSRLVFERALGAKIKVGCIACPDAAYDVNHWWRTSEGFKTITEEVVSYMWARMGL